MPGLFAGHPRSSHSADGRREMTFRIPGTGLSWRRPLRRRR
ncbi:hypothetical protein [Spirillospora sp. CA-128828]